MKKLIILLFLSIGISSCQLYDPELLIELRYTIRIEHCAQNGFDVIPVHVQKKQGVAPEFIIKKCSLYLIVEKDTSMIHDHCYRYWIIGQDTKNMGAVR